MDLILFAVTFWVIPIIVAKKLGKSRNQPGWPCGLWLAGSA
jgi:hypothetical protein